MSITSGYSGLENLNFSESEKYRVCHQIRQRQIERYLEFESAEEQKQKVKKPDTSEKKVHGKKYKKKKNEESACAVEDVVKGLAKHSVTFDKELYLQSFVEEMDEQSGKEVRYTMLHKAIDLTPDSEEQICVLESLNAGANFNFVTGNGISLLHKACTEGCVPIVELLLEGGANVNYRDDDGWTPLHIACYQNNLEVVQTLLKHNADATILNVDGNFPVDQCTKGTNSWRLMIQHMENLGITSKKMHEMRSCQSHTMEEDVKLFLQLSADINLHLYGGVTLLHIASANGFIRVARCLLKEKANVFVVDDAGLTPLHCAAKFSQLKMVELLLAYGADVGAKDHHGNRPIDYATSEDIQKLLFTIGAEQRRTVTSLLQVGENGWMDSEEEDEDFRCVESSVTSKHIFFSHASMSKVDRLLEARLLLQVDNVDRKEEKTNSAAGDEEEEIYSCIWKSESYVKISLPKKTSTDDLADMPVVDENTILWALLKRFKSTIIYTYVSDILVALNPFTPLPIYGKNASAQYNTDNAYQSSLTPHVYGVSQKMLDAMLQTNVPQCCVIGGESGSGKTETCKHIIQHLLWNASSKEQDLTCKLAQVNPLLEAFGNAQTVMNSNSSRFAKFLSLSFSSSRKVVGGEINEFLLEKSRVVCHAAGETNFHIFYWMLAGVTPEEANHCFLHDSTFRYLNSNAGSFQYQQSSEDKTKFWEVKESLKFIGFTSEDVTCVIMILSAILHLGNIVFSHSNKDEDAAQIKDMEVVRKVCTLLRLSEEDFKSALVEDVIVTRGEHVRKSLTPLQARDTVDGLAKALYSRLFTWIVNGLNQMVQEPPDSNSSQMSIRILDLFGFENLRHNGFEQMCINIANEKLQTFYNLQVFENELRDCEAEGITSVSIVLPDNQSVIALFMEKNTGIFDLLDEESKFPKATDESLAAKLHSVSGKAHRSVYKSPRYGGLTFSVAHFAGSITYSLGGIVKTNRDALRTAMGFVMRGSASLIIKELFNARLSQTGSITASKRQQVSRHQKGGKSPFDFFRKLKKSNQKTKDDKKMEAVQKRSGNTLTYHFKNSLNELMTKIQNSSCHFIRCIKPNEDRIPLVASEDFIKAQLCFTGVNETVQIRKHGFSFRTTYQHFLELYPVLASLTNRVCNQEYQDPKPTTVSLLNKFGVKKYRVGRTKIFIPQNEVKALNLLEKSNFCHIVKVQATVRRYLAMKQVSEMMVRQQEFKDSFQEFANLVMDKQEEMSETQALLVEIDKNNIEENIHKEEEECLHLLESVLNEFLGSEDQWIKKSVDEDDIDRKGEEENDDDVFEESRFESSSTIANKEDENTLPASCTAENTTKVLSPKLQRPKRPPPPPPPSTPPVAVSQSSSPEAFSGRGFYTPVLGSEMDPSRQFPPSPKEMYMYRPGQHLNGHNGQPASPSRGGPPPTLPERKPETQLGNRNSTGRSSFSSRSSASSDVLTPPQSPSIIQHDPLLHQHLQQPQDPHQQHRHHGQKRHQENRPFTYAAGPNPSQAAHLHAVNNAEIRIKDQRDASPHSSRGSIKSEGRASNGDHERYNHSEGQDSPLIYQKINGSRSRGGSTPDALLSRRDGYGEERISSSGEIIRQPDDIYGKFVQPSPTGHHRPTLTYVPPPMVPPSQSVTSKRDPNSCKPPLPHDHQHNISSQQHLSQQQQQQQQQYLIQQELHRQHHHQHQQSSQPKAINNNEHRSSSPHHHHHHQQHHHHDQSQNLHQQQHLHGHPSSAFSHYPTQPQQISLQKSPSPLGSPKLGSSGQRAKTRQDGIPPPPSFPAPPPPVPMHDRYGYADGRRTPSPPPPPPPSGSRSSRKSKSSTKGMNSTPLSPRVQPKTHQDFVDANPHHPHSPGAHAYSNQYFYPQDQQYSPAQPQNHVVQPIPVTCPPAPPPPPTSNPPSNRNLNPTPAGLRSPRSGSPVRPLPLTPHQHHKQPTAATMDELSQIKLKTVTDTNHATAKSPPSDEMSSGGINVRLRPTQGKFSNIYAEEETTLPPPPPDDLDDLPPPPPPPELLASLSLAPSSMPIPTHPQQYQHTPYSPHPQQQLLAGEVHSSGIHHSSLGHQQEVASSSSTSFQHQASAGSRKLSASSGGETSENYSSGLERLIAESVAKMDFEIPDDIDLTQCPGLVEIDKNIPNWKRSMVEKKNQEKIEEYVKQVLREREQAAKWKNVPEWKRKILQKKEEEDAAAANAANAPKEGAKQAPKKAAPPPVEDEFAKPRGDIVPAALSIDPEELAAMPPWKRELLFKRDKVPVSFGNEFNPEDEEGGDQQQGAGIPEMASS